jgi:hypothetical protein
LAPEPTHDSEPADPPRARQIEPTAPQLSRAGEQVLELSPPMQLLLRRLAAFEKLTARGDLERAAIVAEDVRGTLESFDPRVYFPRLFSPYARAFANHVNDLAPYWDNLGSPSWRALDQLYRLDLDAFLAE